MLRSLTLLVIALCASAAIAQDAPVPAEPAGEAAGASAENFQSLDQEVQALKKEVLDLNRELFVLEEDLLFPANTQVAVFVSLADDQEFRLDAVQLSINGELVAHYIYSFKELEALKNGGVVNRC